MSPLCNHNINVSSFHNSTVTLTSETKHSVSPDRALKLPSLWGLIYNNWLIQSCAASSMQSYSRHYNLTLITVALTITAAALTIPTSSLCSISCYRFHYALLFLWLFMKVWLKTVNSLTYISLMEITLIMTTLHSGVPDVLPMLVH